MNFLLWKLILDSFRRSSCFVATRGSTLQDGANESPESLTARETECDYNFLFLGVPGTIRGEGFRRKQILSATVIFLPITLRKIRSRGISFETGRRWYPIEAFFLLAVLPICGVLSRSVCLLSHHTIIQRCLRT